jgi:hypothetical protein
MKKRNSITQNLEPTQTFILHIVLCIGLVHYCVECHDDCWCAFVLQPKTLIGTFEDHKENKKGRKEIK